MKIIAELHEYVPDVIHDEMPDDEIGISGYLRALKSCGYRITHIDGDEYIGRCKLCICLVTSRAVPGKHYVKVDDGLLCASCWERVQADCKKTDRYDATQLPSIEDCSG